MTRQLYDAWGNIRSSGVSGGSMPTDIGFTGQRLDNSTGLMYYRARYYAQGLGRFISADTIVPDGKNPQQFNRYAYGLNNPVYYKDPTGHFSQSQIEDYLRNQHGANWEKYLRAWQTDNIFWSMLRLAAYGDTLSAPTVNSLGSGLFTQSGNTFGFVGINQKDTLFTFQGYGPYELMNGTAMRLSVRDQIPTHFVESRDTGVSQQWTQPLYRYGKDGPMPTGFMRTVSYRRSQLPHVDLGAGSGLPWWLGLVPKAADWMLKQWGEKAIFGPYISTPLVVISAAQGLNNMLVWDHNLTVAYSDERTYMGPPGMEIPATSPIDWVDLVK